MDDETSAALARIWDRMGPPWWRPFKRRKWRRLGPSLWSNVNHWSTYSLEEAMFVEVDRIMGEEGW